MVEERAPRTPVHVVLVRPEGAINVGSVARLVKNFGAASLRLVAPIADVRGREARMFADRAQDVLASARICPTLKDALIDVDVAVGTSSKLRETQHVRPFDASYAASLRPAHGEKPVALVFGNEADGLSREEAAACHRVVRMETPGEYDSLNLSHAVAVALALFASPADDGESRTAPASASQSTLLRLERDWLAALERAGYFRRNRPAAFAPRLAALLTRLAPSEEDAKLLADMWSVMGSALEDAPADDGASDIAIDLAGERAREVPS